MPDPGVRGRFGNREYQVGFATSRWRSPTFSVSASAAVLLVVSAVRWDLLIDPVPGAVVRWTLGILGVGLVAHQVWAGCTSVRDCRRYGLKQIPREPDTGIGRPNTWEVAPEYARSLIETGFRRYREFDLERSIELLLTPQRSTMRITEEVVPDEPVAVHRVVKEIQFSGEVSGRIAIPVAEFPKGVMLDDLQVRVNDRPARLMSYEESLGYAALLMLVSRVAEDHAPAELRAALAADVRRIASPAAAQVAGPPVEAATRAEALLGRFAGDYVFFAIVDLAEGAAVRVEYQRATSIRSLDQSGIAADRRDEVRFRLGQFPRTIALRTSLMYECVSYHLRITLPSGLYVESHKIRAMKNEKMDFVQVEDFERGESEKVATPPPYMRTRDHRALPYAHFYARNGAGFAHREHTHVIEVQESPFATLRLAATLAVFAAVGIVVAGTAIPGGNPPYGFSGSVVAIAVSAPGVLAAWSRQVFGIKALHRSCLTTQVALRLTTVGSLAGLVLAILQAAGHLRWYLDAERRGLLAVAPPIHDGYWLILGFLAVAGSAFVSARYRKRRAQYLALRRRALITHPIDDRSARDVRGG